MFSSFTIFKIYTHTCCKEAINYYIYSSGGLVPLDKLSLSKHLFLFDVALSFLLQTTIHH